MVSHPLSFRAFCLPGFSRMLSVILPGLLGVGLVAGLVVPTAGAQSIPPQSQPGAILNHQMRMMQLQQMEPWRNGYYDAKSLDPSNNEPVIYWVDTDVDAHIEPGTGMPAMNSDEEVPAIRIP